MTTVQIEGADRLMKLLLELPREVTQSKRGGVVGKALRKGANVILKEERQTLYRAIQINGDDSTGLLMKNLKIRRKRYKGNGERVTIGVGNKRYPGAEGMRGKTTRLNGQRLEYGTSEQAATPWARPAFEAKAQEAIQVTVDTLSRDLEKLAQQHLRGG